MAQSQFTGYPGLLSYEDLNTHILQVANPTVFGTPLSVVTTITPSQLREAYTNPIEILPPPGENKIIFPLSFFACFKPGTEAFYSVNATILLNYTGIVSPTIPFISLLGGNAADTSNNTLFQGNNTQIAYGVGGGFFWDDTLVNAGMSVSTNGDLGVQGVITAISMVTDAQPPPTSYHEGDVGTLSGVPPLNAPGEYGLGGDNNARFVIDSVDEAGVPLTYRLTDGGTNYLPNTDDAGVRPIAASYLTAVLDTNVEDRSAFLYFNVTDLTPNNWTDSGSCVVAMSYVVIDISTL